MLFAALDGQPAPGRWRLDDGQLRFRGELAPPAAIGRLVDIFGTWLPGLRASRSLRRAFSHANGTVDDALFRRLRRRWRGESVPIQAAVLGLLLDHALPQQRLRMVRLAMRHPDRRLAVAALVWQGPGRDTEDALLRLLRCRAAAARRAHFEVIAALGRLGTHACVAALRRRAPRSANRQIRTAAALAIRDIEARHGPVQPGRMSLISRTDEAGKLTAIDVD